MSTITGTVRSVLGDVKVLKASGEEVTLLEGDVIASGDVITTGTDSSAYIEFPGMDGKDPTEGILQANSKATLNGSELAVESGEFEVLSDGENQIVSVTGGGMFGLFGAGLLAGNTAAALGAAAGAAFVISENNDSDGAPAEEASVAPAAIQTVAETVGPAGPTVTQAYSDLGAVTPLTDDALSAASPITTSAEPVLEETAPVIEAAEPLLTPTNEVGEAALEGLAPVTGTLESNLAPVTDGLAEALSPATDVLLGNEDGQLSAAADTLPINVRVLAENIAAGLDQAAPPLADGLNQAVTALEPALGPLNDGLTQLASALEPVFQGLKGGADQLTTVSQPLADGLQQLFDALAPVLGPLTAALAGSESGGDAASGPLPTTNTPLDQVLAPLNDAIATLQGLAGEAGGGDSGGDAASGPLPTTNTPLDQVFAPINDAIATLQGLAGGAGGGESATPSLTAGVDMIAQAIVDNAAGTPLEPVGDTLFSVSDAVGSLGDTLSADQSALNPVTNPLGGVVGSGDADGLAVPGTLADVGDALVELTSAELEPLSALTGPLDDGLNTLADGLSTAGDQIVSAAGADPSGVGVLVGELLGGESSDSSSGSGGGEASPLDAITSALPLSSSALPDELAGPLSPVLSQLPL